MAKELNRKLLYELVWSKPMSTVAKDFGLSDRGLAKLCERNSIPVPPRGYWAKKAAGKKAPKPPLLILESKEPETAILLRQAIRDYIAAVGQAQEEGRFEVEFSAFNAWRSWAEAHADSLDFIASGNPLISLEAAPEDLGSLDEGVAERRGYASARGSDWFPGRKWFHR